MKAGKRNMSILALKCMSMSFPASSFRHSPVSRQAEFAAPSAGRVRQQQQWFERRARTVRPLSAPIFLIPAATPAECRDAACAAAAAAQQKTRLTKALDAFSMPQRQRRRRC